MNDTKDEFMREILFQIARKIHISKTPNELAGLDSADYGDAGRWRVGWWCVCGGGPSYARYFCAVRHD